MDTRRQVTRARADEPDRLSGGTPMADAAPHDARRPRRIEETGRGHRSRGAAMRSLRHLGLLLAVAVCAPSVAGAAASDGSIRDDAGRTASAGVRSERSSVALAPAPVAVTSIQFARGQGANNAPIDPATRFSVGVTTVFAFVDYREATPGDVMRYVFRHRDSTTDVAFGDLRADSTAGRFAVPLERADRLPLMVGTFDLFIQVGINELGRASFEVFEGDGGNDNDDGDSSDNASSDNDNASSDNDDDSSDNDDNDDDSSDNDSNDNDSSDND